ncbi:hypothetical protein GWP85_07000 [Acinetobacter beijerinckii]|uniref:hypothetical protein n=1 Tax=Acinetobacter beijerinckii TaxID=262668 RepID=UPI0023DDD358|nr:hypothetical protein [Acinetobacter beijerinckii]MDF2417265.1 hypothetical protein [Acinetobacter beijerinckii]
MEQNVLNHNRSYTLGKSFLIGSAISAITLGGLTGAYALVTKLVETNPVYSYANTNSMYGVMSAKITSETTGEAIVNLNGYHVFTSFDFELEPDYNGQLGSDTQAVFIKKLAVDRVLLSNGGFYNDFTNADDIRNMISVITAHIEKNKMVESI